MPELNMSRDDIIQRQKKGLELIIGYDMFYPIEKAYYYSDLGYILLGNVVTKATNKELLSDAMNDVLINPLNLKCSYNPKQGFSFSLCHGNVYRSFPNCSHRVL